MTKTFRVLFLDDDKYRHDEFDRLLRVINHEEPYREMLGDTVVVVDHTWTAKGAIESLKTISTARHTLGEHYDACSLDHDLADVHYEDLKAALQREDTGREVTQFLADNLDLCPRFVNVHSWNPDGGRAMAFQVAEARRQRSICGETTKETFPSIGWLLSALRESREGGE